MFTLKDETSVVPLLWNEHPNNCYCCNKKLKTVSSCCKAVFAILYTPLKEYSSFVCKQLHLCYISCGVFAAAKKYFGSSKSYDKITS